MPSPDRRIDITRYTPIKQFTRDAFGLTAYELAKNSEPLKWLPARVQTYAQRVRGFIAGFLEATSPITSRSQLLRRRSNWEIGQPLITNEDFINGVLVRATVLADLVLNGTALVGAAAITGVTHEPFVSLITLPASCAIKNGLVHLTFDFANSRANKRMQTHIQRYLRAGSWNRGEYIEVDSLAGDNAAKDLDVLPILIK